MKKPTLWLGFDIQTTSGPCLQPHRLNYWQEQHFKSNSPEAPFHFKADALAGLAFLQLNRDRQNPFSTPKVDYHFANESWLAMEPHHEMFVRCQPRVNSLRQNIKPAAAGPIAAFERAFSGVLDSAWQKTGLNLDVLTDLIKCTDDLEAQLGHALLYDFSLQLHKDTTKILHHLHSLLFNLRVLIAMDHNAHVQDPTYEAVRVDSISDYLPKAEYVGNDAVLFHHFCQLKDQMPAAVASEMGRAFGHFSHNATCLIDNLPKAFLKSLPGENIEDALYLVQMDWLLGTEAGLLFRVREELYGLLEGYDKVFWPELDGKSHQPAHSLSINCQLGEKDLYPGQEAA